MSFSRSSRFTGKTKRLMAFVGLFTLMFSVVGVAGSAPASAEEAPAEVGVQEASDISTQSSVRLTGALDQLIVAGSYQPMHVSGWACAPDEPGRILRIDVYNFGVSDDQPTREAFLGSLTANKTREPAVGAACGGNRNHGYSGFINPSCTGQIGNGLILVDIRAWAVYSDNGDAIELPGVRTSLTSFCP